MCTFTGRHQKRFDRRREEEEGASSASFSKEVVDGLPLEDDDFDNGDV